MPPSTTWAGSGGEGVMTKYYIENTFIMGKESIYIIKDSDGTVMIKGINEVAIDDLGTSDWVPVNSLSVFNTIKSIRDYIMVYRTSTIEEIDTSDLFLLTL